MSGYSAASAAAAVGDRVRRARLARGLKIRELADLIRVSPATVSQLENGKALLTVVRLEEIATALQLPATRILAGDVQAVPAAALGAPAQSGDEGSARDWRQYRPLIVDPIVSAALVEFLEFGYHGTTMRRISARSGVSVPGIYAHFESKQAILYHILDVTIADLEWRMVVAVDGITDPVARLSRLVENLALYHTHRRELGFIGVSEVRALEPAHRQSTAARRTALQEAIDRELRAGLAQRVFAIDNAADAGRVLVSMCTALSTWWRPDGRLSPEAAAAQCVTFALRLVRAPDRGEGR